MPRLGGPPERSEGGEGHRMSMTMSEEKRAQTPLRPAPPTRRRAPPPSGGVVAGAVIAVIAGIGILAALVFFLLRHRRRHAPAHRAARRRPYGRHGEPDLRSARAVVGEHHVTRDDAPP
ncbi:hypothetical protein C8J57DRAFT_1523934 [Mycena rebaudengoi]|nr:hypothetical protein C8J57DRAFT_1523934 [Mycena rebaudengoi]